MQWTVEIIERIQHLFPTQRGNVVRDYLTFLHALQYIAANGEPCPRTSVTGIPSIIDSVIGLTPGSSTALKNILCRNSLFQKELGEKS